MATIATQDLSIDWVLDSRKTVITTVRSQIWDDVHMEAEKCIRAIFPESNQQVLDEAINSLKAMKSKEAARSYLPIYVQFPAETTGGEHDDSASRAANRRVTRRKGTRSRNSSQELAKRLFRQVSEYTVQQSIEAGLVKIYPRGPYKTGNKRATFKNMKHMMAAVTRFATHFRIFQRKASGSIIGEVPFACISSFLYLLAFDKDSLKPKWWKSKKATILMFKLSRKAWSPGIDGDDSDTLGYLESGVDVLLKILNCFFEMFDSRLTIFENLGNLDELVSSAANVLKNGDIGGDVRIAYWSLKEITTFLNHLDDIESSFKLYIETLHVQAAASAKCLYRLQKVDNDEEKLEAEKLILATSAYKNNERDQPHSSSVFSYLISTLPGPFRALLQLFIYLDDDVDFHDALVTLKKAEVGGSHERGFPAHATQLAEILRLSLLLSNESANLSKHVDFGFVVKNIISRIQTSDGALVEKQKKSHNESLADNLDGWSDGDESEEV